MKKFLLKSLVLLCALVVGSLDGWADSAEFSYSNFSGQGASGSGGTLTGATKGDITITGKGNGNTSYLQVYANNYLTITPNDGATITKIELTATTSNYIKTWTASDNSTVSISSSKATWKGSSTTEITLTNSATAQARITAITVTYTPSGSSSNKVESPTFSIETGTYTTAQNVTLACDTEGATIHYTMTVDGTTPDDPSESDATYSTAISVTKSGTIIKAKAFKNGMTASSVVTATYTIKPNKPTITATGATVTITADEGCAIFYTTDNSTPSKSSTLYTGPFNPNADCSIKTRAYDAYDNASDVRQYNYVYLPLAPKNINSNHYEKVTDVSTLENGDAVLIVCESDNVAMSTTQNNNNRGQAEITITNNTIDNPSSNVQKIVLMKIGNFFYFYTGSGYLYAPSSSSNYLKTEETPDDNNNAKAEITISSGDATILFKGNSSRNWLKHNSSYHLFSCYASNDENQHIVQLYKEIPVEPTQPVVVGETVTLTTTANMAGWRTFAPVKADQNYTVDGTTKVYYASATAGGKVTLAEIAEGVPANTPVILHQTSGTTITLTETATNITAPGSNLLKVSTASQDLGTVYRLGYKSAYGVGFYTYTTNSAPAGIVYLETVTAAHEFLGFDFDGETTAINNLTPSLSKGEGEYYDLQGRRIANGQKPTAKGLYIVNGKKVIVK